ncbi:MAG: DegQ family serine endoprotease [Pyrinomonadaceae bacterium]
MQESNIKKEIVEIIRKNPLQILGAAWISFLVVAFMVVGFMLPHTSRNSVLAADPAADVNSSLAARSSYADTVDRVSPAVVTVRSERKAAARTEQMPFTDDPRFREFFGGRLPNMQQQRPQTERAMGSGVIVSADGMILTNNHVVEGADKLKVELPDRRTFDAKVVGTDKLSDLAVLKIEAGNLPVLTLGDSDKTRVGDVVLAVGYPLGLRQTVTSGIISAKGRSTGLSDGSFEDFLQTDAPINHGNSGGALVNLNAELIGINSQILSPSGGSIGIGFSIPSNMAKSVMDQLIKNGKVSRGMLGIGIQNVTSDLAQQFGLKDIRGVIINSVRQGSPADKAGVKQGDVVVAINNVPVTDNNELRNRVAQSAPGSQINLTVLRDGKEQNLTATLTEFSLEKVAANNDDDDNGEDNSGTSRNVPNKGGALGLSLQTLTLQIASQLGLKGVTQGLVVADVQDGSPADDAGIAQGDVIQQINRQTVNSLADVKTALAKSVGKPALLLINRQGQTVFVTVPTQ